MSQYMLSGTPPVEINLKKSSRAKRISLRVSQLDGRVTLTVPLRASRREALEFAQQKADWLRENLARRPTDVLIKAGNRIPVHGVMLEIVEGTGRRVKIIDDTIVVPASTPTAQNRIAPRISGFLKGLARDQLAAASDYYAKELGRSYTKLSLRDTRSRWGSCSSNGGLMYSWRLIMAPSEVLKYVAAHEVAHLAEMNHSPAFWGNVARLYPDYERPRKWLRENGGSLHQYRFDN